MIFNEYSVPIKFLTYLYCFDFIFLTALHTHSAKKKEKTRKKPQTPNPELHYLGLQLEYIKRTSI